MMEQRRLVSLEVVSLLVGDYYRFCDKDVDDDDDRDCDDDHVYNLCVYPDVLYRHL